MNTSDDPTVQMHRGAYVLLHCLFATHPGSREYSKPPLARLS